MTESKMSQQASPDPQQDRERAATGGRITVPPQALRFEQIYVEHFAFVWRSLRRLGVPPAGIDDAAQEVFVVVHRKLSQLDVSGSLRPWLSAVVARVAKDCRRTAQRKDPRKRSAEEGPDVESIEDLHSRTPHEAMERAEAVQLLHEILDELDWPKRETFVLVELEQLGVPEVAGALGENANTVHSRLRAARIAFNQAVARKLARDRWRTQ
jgi:RNA polymerase sigma-70 factor, ECF subfamily